MDSNNPIDFGVWGTTIVNLGGIKKGGQNLKKSKKCVWGDTKKIILR